MSLVLVCTNNKTKLFSLGGVATTVLISTISLLSFDVFADDVIDEVTLSIPVSCTMTGVGMDTHTVTLKNGQANSNVGETTIKAYCNDIEGFAIYAIGFTDNEDGKNVLTDSSLGSEYDIATGTATGPVNNVDNSNWAMKLSTVTSPTPTYPLIIAGSTDDTEREQGDLDYSTFQPVPDSYALVAKRNANTDIGTNAEGSTLKTTYQIYVSTTQTAGTYNGQVKYTLVHPSTAEAPLSPQTTQTGKICYYPNGSNVEGTMGCQTIPASGTTDGVSPTSATLLAGNYSRTGYGFAGWSNKYDYATNPNQEGIKFYGPQEDITFTAGQYTGDSNGLSLYAVWVKSAGSIQDTNKVAELCGTGANALTTAPTDGTANLSSVSALTDQRDNQTYAIAKLADGKCWMIENLRLDNTNSDNSTGVLAQGYGTSATYGNFSGLANPESANFSNSTTANSLYYSGTQDGTASIDIGTSNYPDYRMPRYNNTNTSARASSPTTNGTSMYSYGNYYTWHAAIADLTHNGTTNSSVTNTSLCPTGWHLPRGGNKSNEANNDFWSLIVTGINGGINPANYESSTSPYYTGSPEGSDISKAIRAYPNNLLRSGYFHTSSARNRGGDGYYWSSTAYNIGLSYRLYLFSSHVSPGTANFNKSYGQSIRCMVSAGT